LIELFTYALYGNVCRSIFEKDKLLFSFLLTSNIILSEGKIDLKQYELLTSTLSGLENPLDMPNPASDWLPQSSWNKLCTCAKKDKVFFCMVNNFRENK
jgi:dynein heavy chain